MNRILVRRPFAASDAETLSSWLSRDPYELFLTSSSLPFPLEAAQFLDYWKRSAEPGKHEFFTYLKAEGLEHVGHCELKAISERHRHGTIANVFISPSVRGRGFGTAMIDDMLGRAFDELRLHRVGLSVHDGNLPALNTYRRSGFRHEGTIRDVLWFGNRYHSLCQMSILSDEHAAIFASRSRS